MDKHPSAPMTANDARQAFEFVVTKVQRVHPKTLDGTPPELEAAINRARAAITEPLTPSDFYFVVSEMLAVLNDSHSAIEVREEALANYAFIRLPFQWLDEGIVVTKDTDQVNRGDQVQSIGGLSEAAVLSRLRSVISSENDYFIKGRAPEKLTRTDFLGYLGPKRADGSVEVELERNGERFGVNLAAGDLESDTPDRHWVGYNIEPEQSLGLFYLDTCEYNDEYTTTLNEFMTKVSQENLRTVAVDLRRNRGGLGLVADAFLVYLSADYDSFAMRQRMSDEFLEQVPIFNSDWVRQLAGTFDVDLDSDSFVLPKEAVKAGALAQMSGGETDKALEFDGDLYILTSGLTHSSANLFATMVQDNNLGRVLGEPTGNEVNLFGNMLTFDIPGTDYLLTLASDRKLRPDESRPNQPAVMPDVYVPTTRADIIDGKDTQLEWLRRFASNPTQS